ncbi:MAG: hypothetical protein HYX86_05645 [Chloroflexi bacterium]|nr:hypothetical protein [Chloroflexota bacterium]
MDIPNLLSGFIGALVGGFLSYMGAIKAAERTIKATYQQEREKRKTEEEQTKHSIARRLLAEVSENLLLAEEVQIAHAKIRFITDVWSSVKGALFFLGEDLQEDLQRGYADIHRYNVLAEYEQVKVGYGTGYLDKAIIERGQKVKDSLMPCKEKLQKWIE